MVDLKAADDLKPNNVVAVDDTKSNENQQAKTTLYYQMSDLNPYSLMSYDTFDQLLAHIKLTEASYNNGVQLLSLPWKVSAMKVFLIEI